MSKTHPQNSSSALSPLYQSYPLLSLSLPQPLIAPTPHHTYCPDFILHDSMAGAFSVLQHPTSLDDIVFHFISTHHRHVFITRFPYLKFHLYRFDCNLVKLREKYHLKHEGRKQFGIFRSQVTREREKRVREKERKEASATKATNGISEGESAPEPSPETTSITVLEYGAREKLVIITKMFQKAPQFTKQTKEHCSSA